MNKSFIATIVLSGAVWAAAASANESASCRFHGSKPAAESVVTSCADERKLALVKGGKLDPSWTAIKPERIETIDGKTGKEWKLTFRNPAVTNASKQTLYMFYSLPATSSARTSRANKPRGATWPRPRCAPECSHCWPRPCSA